MDIFSLLRRAHLCNLSWHNRVQSPPYFETYFDTVSHQFGHWFEACIVCHIPYTVSVFSSLFRGLVAEWLHHPGSHAKCVQERSTNHGSQVAVETKFSALGPSICGCTNWNTLQVSFLAPRNFRWPLFFLLGWNLCSPSLQASFRNRKAGVICSHLPVMSSKHIF